MRRTAIALSLAALLKTVAAQAQEPTFGCIEAPEVRGGEYDTRVLTRVLSYRPTCVRLRFRLDLWRSVDDPEQRGPGDRRLVGVGGLHDELIREAERAGAFVILTVGLDAANVTPAELGDVAARARYAEAVASLVTRYRGRIRAIELEGQPNRRAPGDAGVVDRIAPGVYATMLLDVQTRLRPLAEAIRCEMPAVIAGGVYDGPAARMGTTRRAWFVAFSEALAADPRTARLRAAGREPVADLGLQFEAEGRPGLSANYLAGGVEGMLIELDEVYRATLRDAPRPRIWVTAGAYRAASPSVNDIRQTVEATAFFAVGRRSTLPFVPFVVGWSPVVEPMTACEGYGLFRDCIVDDEHLRDSAGAVSGGLNERRPDPWSKLEFTDPAVRVAAGSTATVRLRVTNAGPSTSTSLRWTASTNIFIGQAEGCPANPAVNSLPWTNLPPGSTPGAFVLGARIPVSRPTPILPTASMVVEWAIAPPRDLAPGMWSVSARLLEGTRWFGPTATIPVEVLPPTEMDAGVMRDGSAVLDARAEVSDVHGGDEMDSAVAFVDDVTDVGKRDDRGDARDGAAVADAGPPVRDSGCACATRSGSAFGRLWLVAMTLIAVRRRSRRSLM